MGKSRKQATLRNISLTFVYQLGTIVLGFFIPMMFLKAYGPSIHGLTSAITGIMSYVLLLNAGLNTASMQALYEPLSKSNTNRINEVLNAIKHYYFYTGVSFSVVIIIISFILPLFIQDISSVTVLSLMLVMGLQSTLDCFLVSKYRILLRADQKIYVTMVVSTFTLILRGIVQIILISKGFPVVIVQAVPAVMLILTMIMLKIYVKKHYPSLDRNVRPDKTSLSKRWSAFIHQLSGLLVNNMDIFLLTTIFGNMVLISIYSVYQMVFTYLYSLLTSVFSQGTVASFGNLMSSNKKDSLRSNFRIYELIYYMVLSIVYSVCAVMILPFVALYTEGIKNVPYIDSKLAILFIIIGISTSLRVPGGTLINAGGFYKETQWRAILEALINLVASIILMQFLGIYGLLLGTIISFAYRTTDIIIYSNSKILNQSASESFFRLLRVITVVLCSVVIFNMALKIEISTWFMWISVAIAVGIFSLLLTIIINLIWDYKELNNTFSVMRQQFFNKRKNKSIKVSG